MEAAADNRGKRIDIISKPTMVSNAVRFSS